MKTKLAIYAILLGSVSFSLGSFYETQQAKDTIERVKALEVDSLGEQLKRGEIDSLEYWRGYDGLSSSFKTLTREIDPLTI